MSARYVIRYESAAITAVFAQQTGALQAQALLEAWGGDLDQPPPSASSRSSS